MPRTLLLLLIALAGHSTALPASAQDWQLVWSDEFDGTEVDATKWEFQIGDGCPDLCGWGNGEEQYYTDQNATIDGGILKIEARREELGGRSYTSSRLRTMGKAAFRYGRIELRAKMPRGSGYWPAVWMLPEDEAYGGWAASGEIDILEVFGNDAGTVHGTLHFGGVSPRNTFRGGSYTLPVRDFSRSFHDFAIEWVPGEIRWYVDGILYHTARDWYSTEARFPAPFDQDFHLLVNVAVGGAGGDPANTSFPQSMEIDYIRVYQSGNEPPAVSLDSPVDGASVVSGGDVTITATASDADGLISRVEFYSGDALLAQDDEAPFELTVSTASDGCYSIRARAIDNLGGETWSRAASLTVGSCGQAPYLMAAQAVPGVIQAEYYDIGGEAEAYHDVDAVNSGAVAGLGFRAVEGVDIGYGLGAEQGYFVSGFEAGEWLEYQISVPVSGAFNVDLRTASSAGGMASLHVDDTEVAGNLTIPAGTEFSTTRASNIQLAEGTHTLRVQADQGDFDLDYVTVLAYVEPPPAGTVLVEDFADPTGAAWSYFGSASGTVTTGDGVNPYMRATFSGAGGSGGGFYGVMWNNLEDTQQAVLPADPWFNIRVRHSSTETTVSEYTLEITVREDTNGDGWTSGQEDSHRFDTRFSSSSFNDEWIQISAPLTAFTNLGTGGNGILELAIDEVVLVVSQVVGPDPSSVVVDFDDIIISTGGVGTAVEDVLPSAVRLYQPYPNPSSGTINMAYSLDTPGLARIEVIDMLGRRVHPPIESFEETGQHWLNLNLDQVAPGVYFIRLDVGGAIKTQRVVIAR